MTWVLVYWIVSPSGAGVASDQLKGFESKAACTKAFEEMSSSTLYSIGGICLSERVRSSK